MSSLPSSGKPRQQKSAQQKSQSKRMLAYLEPVPTKNAESAMGGAADDAIEVDAANNMMPLDDDATDNDNDINIEQDLAYHHSDESS
ncbi:hypothetical protein FRB94_013518 [Tulasnella sp. JGI-2019a]|nr:hypothetical protein FRB93_005135 [Tulasnella sp. JGI-2019a]KAG9014208.1 hypothetical protein FRB94_013518 [Tulasnella sp. JGI-2019a]